MYPVVNNSNLHCPWYLNEGISNYPKKVVEVLPIHGGGVDGLQFSTVCGFGGGGMKIKPLNPDISANIYGGRQC